MRVILTRINLRDFYIIGDCYWSIFYTEKKGVASILYLQVHLKEFHFIIEKVIKGKILPDIFYCVTEF